jgi:hypothetical protein
MPPAPRAATAEPARGWERPRALGVWTAAANPWHEGLAGDAPSTIGPRPGRRASGWRRLLAWLIEYNRY